MTLPRDIPPLPRQSVPGYGLGLHFRFDEKSRDYPIRTLLTGAPLQNRYWDTYVRVNQGSTPRCVGYGCADELAAIPVPIAGINNGIGDQIYALAQKLDEIPGENYEGSTALGGMKALKQLGYIGEYRWAFGIDDVVQTISEFGPVCLATQWYNSMFTPLASGQLVINGASAGGHFYMADEYEVSTGKVWLLNSWGEFWGVKGQAKRGGRAWMYAEDVSKLLKQGGQAPVITQRFDPSGPPPPPPAPPVNTDELVRLRALISAGQFVRMGWNLRDLSGEDKAALAAIVRASQG